MRFKILTLSDNRLLLDFLLWLTPEALDFWYHYGKTFDKIVVEKIVFGHLYHFTKDSCRLGIVSGIVGEGYGTKMMVELIKIAKKVGCQRIYLSTFQDNSKAVSLYRRFGFIISREFTDRPRKNCEMVLEL